MAGFRPVDDIGARRKAEGSADQSGTGRGRGDQKAEDRPTQSLSGPALVEQPCLEWTRAATIAYTALWQLRDLDPSREPRAFHDARVELRKILDAIDADAEASPRQPHRSLLEDQELSEGRQ